jgi:acetyl esterase/lipase
MNLPYNLIVLKLSFRGLPMFRFVAGLVCLIPCCVVTAAEPTRAAAAVPKIEFDSQYSVPYAMVGERELLLDAFIPQTEGPHPAVLVVHGGSWKSGNRMQLRAYAMMLANLGMSCFCIDYRLAPEHKFPAQIDDCRTAIGWIRQHADEYKVDPNRIGAIGYSAGGHLVSLLATTGQPPSDQNGHVDTRIQAAAAGGAPTDFRTFDDNGKWAEYWMGGDLDSVPEKFHDASSVAFVDPSDTPVFFFNGTADDLVNVKWSQDCHDALRAAGVRTEMHLIEGAGHISAAMNPEAVEKACQFLREVLYAEQPSYVGKPR